ncbi:LPS-assembly protein LptD [Caenispirillum bisanense]|uniref:LPS-assembly protein LptD n=1 Tax=Caenispirillum bisanense TaxID=414052 RepID=UPI0031D26A92
MTRRFTGPLTLTAGLAALLADTGSAAASQLGPGWQPSRPLWETQQAQAPAMQVQAQAQAPVQPVTVVPVAATTDRLEAATAAEPVVNGALETTAPAVTAAPPAAGTVPPVATEALRRQADGGVLAPDIGAAGRNLHALPRPYAPPQVPPTEADEPRTSVVARELAYDDAAEVVTATGEVELIHEGRVLRANTVRYDTVADKVSAEGEVVLMETDGSVYFFDYAELTGDMKEGFARQVTILLADRSRATSEEMARANDVNIMRRAIYTACDPCKDPNAAPLWRLRANEVTHDETEKTITYTDAWLEVAGLPVFYTPYLSHPDPTVKRKSGVMPPTYRQSTELGTQITVPYYYVIDDQQDAEVAVRYTSIEGPVLEAAYSGLYSSGEARAAGSITNDADGTTRGHIKSELMWHFDETWRGGWDVQLSSDDTYMRKYRYGTEAWLVSEGFLEGFSRRSFARGRGLFFQEMRTNSEPERVPVVLPELTYAFSSRPEDNGSYWTFDASTVALTREDGTDTRRASMEAAYYHPYYGSMGDITEFMVSLRGDAYSIDEAENPLYRDVEGGFTGRFVPTAGFTWRWPLARDNGWFREVLEPIASAYISPNNGRNNRLPNEDSQDFEFDATNLFDRNRFAGWDRVETGARVNYGVQWSAYWPEGESVSLLLGQSHHFDDTNQGFGTNGSGSSDYVGRIGAEVAPYLNLGYRFRLDRDDFVMRRQELSIIAGVPALRVGANYLQSSPESAAQDRFGDREQVVLSATSKVSRYWTLFGNTTLSLTGDDDTLKSGFGAIYDDECLTFVAQFQQNLTEDRDYEGGNELILRVVFKTLGEIDVGSSGSAGQR